MTKETDSYTEIYQWFISDCSEDELNILKETLVYYSLIQTY